MKCSFCGQEIKDGALICTKCGSKTADKEIDPKNIQISPSSAKNRGTGIFGAIADVLFGTAEEDDEGEGDFPVDVFESDFVEIDEVEHIQDDKSQDDGRKNPKPLKNIFKRKRSK